MRLRGLLVALAALELLAIAFSGSLTREMPDLEVYWTAANRAAAAEPLYRADDQHYQFKYLPAAALVLSPLARLSLSDARAAWLFVSLALLVGFVSFSLDLPLRSSRPAWLALALVIVGMAKFYGHELVLGQINLLFGFILVLALLVIRRGHEAAAGLLIALAIAIKPYAILFVPWLAARRRWPALAAASIGVFIVLAAPSMRYGLSGDIDLHRAWLRTVAESTAPNLMNADNISVAGACAKWLGPGTAATSLALVFWCALLGAAAVVVLRRGGLVFPEGLEGALLLSLVPLLSPQGWDYVLLLATPAVVYVATYRDALPRGLAIAAIAAITVAGLTIFDLVGRTAYGVFMRAAVVTLCYLLVVAALCAIRVRRAA